MERLVLNQKGIGEVAAVKYAGNGTTLQLAQMAAIVGIRNADGEVITVWEMDRLQSVNPSDVSNGGFYVAHEYTI